MANQNNQPNQAGQGMDSSSIPKSSSQETEGQSGGLSAFFKKIFTSKITLIVLVVFIALEIIGGGIYLNLDKFFPKPASPENQQDIPKTEGNVAGEAKKRIEENRYFEGPKLYEESDGEKILIAVEGEVTNINGRLITVVRSNENTEPVEIEVADVRIFKLEKGTLEPVVADFSSLQVGDKISYNPPSSLSQGALIIH